ncbi:MAG: hypothetical protein ACJ74F_20740 [Mycobacterium sp.]|jgi:hypothetical protein|uniref:hypothetical protein n=1 Tax=Mycobacterium sp. TaxID=1785 RepID=UPI00389A536A
MPVIACSVRTVPLVLALAWAVADVCPASARCTATLMVRPDDGTAAESGAEAAIAETPVTVRVAATCVCGRMEQFAITLTRLAEAPNDWMSLETRDVALPVLPPAVSREDWRTAAV